MIVNRRCQHHTRNIALVSIKGLASSVEEVYNQNQIVSFWTTAQNNTRFLIEDVEPGGMRLFRIIY